MKLFDLSSVVQALNGLGNPDDDFPYKATLLGFDTPKTPKQPDPVYDAFDPSGWYKAVDNARIDPSMLSPVGNTQFLMEPHAALALNAMIQAAAADGVNLAIGNTYRDYETQAAAYRAYKAGEKSAPVASPGTSNHGWGLAVDFSSLATDSAEFQWLVANAAKYGYTNPFGTSNPTEPWHWEFAQDGSAPDPSVLQTVGSTTRRRNPAVAMPDVSRELLMTPAYLSDSPPPLHSVVTTLLSREGLQRTRGRPPTFTGKEASIKEQLYNGFLKVGRPDLAQMVNTKDFQTWIGQESGWNPYSVSQYYQGHGRNFGLFQFWQGHEWTNEYLQNGEWTATPFEQAKLVARYFPGLTAEDIRTYADQIRNGVYRGWP